MSTREELETKLARLNKRISQVNADRAKMEKEEAVRMDRYEEALKELKAKFGIDASDMSGAELRQLLQETQDELEDRISEWEGTVLQAETVIADYKGLQG